MIKLIPLENIVFTSSSVNHEETVINYLKGIEYPFLTASPLPNDTTICKDVKGHYWVFENKAIQIIQKEKATMEIVLNPHNHPAYVTKATKEAIGCIPEIIERAYTALQTTKPANGIDYTILEIVKAIGSIYGTPLERHPLYAVLNQSPLAHFKIGNLLVWQYENHRVLLLADRPYMTIMM
ncbi:MAG: hypothetical protein [Podoviridae sp. ctLUJ1]|nr:MAG: hypothetical protein [Podoviridae sp. ctLUJ1]